MSFRDTDANTPSDPLITYTDENAWSFDAPRAVTSLSVFLPERPSATHLTVYISVCLSVRLWNITTHNPQRNGQTEDTKRKIFLLSWSWWLMTNFYKAIHLALWWEFCFVTWSFTTGLYIKVRLYKNTSTVRRAMLCPRSLQKQLTVTWIKSLKVPSIKLWTWNCQLVFVQPREYCLGTNYKLQDKLKKDRKSPEKIMERMWEGEGRGIQWKIDVFYCIPLRDKMAQLQNGQVGSKINIANFLVEQYYLSESEGVISWHVMKCHDISW